MQIFKCLYLLAAGLLHLHFFCHAAPIFRPTTTNLYGVQELQARDELVERAAIFDARGGKRVYQAPPGTVPAIDWSAIYRNGKKPEHVDADPINKALSHQKQTEVPAGNYYETNIGFHAKTPGHGDTKAHMTGKWYDKAPEQGGTPIADPRGHAQWHTYLAPGSTWQHPKGTDFRPLDVGDPMPKGGMKKKVVDPPVETPAVDPPKKGGKTKKGGKKRRKK